MSTLSKEISNYVDALLARDAEIHHAVAAREFITDHGDIIGFHIEGLVLRVIKDEIKARAQAPAPPFEQGVLFHSLPAAVTVRDGVTKPIRLCTKADLLVGREQKVDNITNARRSLRVYNQDLARLIPFMDDDTTTVLDVINSGVLGEEGAA